LGGSLSFLYFVKILPMHYLSISWIWSLLVSAFSFSFKTTENPAAITSELSSSLANLSVGSSTKQSSSAEAYWEAIPRVLGFQFHKKKLVLDLDETLISSSKKHCLKYDMSVQVYISGTPTTFFVRKRPHVDLFLETVSQWFELVIFTASISEYANAVIDQLDPKRRINRRYYRQSCTHRSGSYLKNLNVVCRDLSKVVIVDNSTVAFSLNKENGIAIPDYFGIDHQDESLLHLLPILEKVRDTDDVRHALIDHPNGVCGILSSPGVQVRRSNRS